jgi:glycosyltransferase involved in cell wall biosynthesis
MASACPGTQPAAAPEYPTDVAKFAVLSHSLSAHGSGQGIMLQRLLRGFGSDNYCLITLEGRAPTAENAQSRGWREAADQGARQYFVGEKWRHVGTGPGPLRSGVRMADVTVRVPLRAAKILQVLKKEEPAVLVACSGDLVDLPAACIAARAAGIPLLPYMFDDYMNQHYRSAERAVAGVLERLCVRGTRSLVVPNEFAADAYEARYGITPHIVRNPVDDAHLAEAPQTVWPQTPGTLRIAYTGAVYHAQADSIVRLLQALGSWRRRERIGLHIYTAQALTKLASFAIPSQGLTLHRQVPSVHIPAVLREADVLLLPLAFTSGIAEVIRTSAPGKMGEYLASGVPILAHTPRDSFVTWYMRRHNCGVVCDTPDSSELRRELERLVDDTALRKVVTANAVECARRDFGVESARASFAQALRSCV